MTTRRSVLKALGGAALALPWLSLLRGDRAWAGNGVAKRVIFFYFPDGVLGPSRVRRAERVALHWDGDPVQPPQAGGAAGPLQERRLFFNGLSMGSTDSGSHPGGAKKLLTGVDGGNGESIDSFLARTAGAGSPWHHLYLGAMANQNNASGDKHIVYPTAGRRLTGR